MRDNIGGGALTETTLLILLAVYAPNHGYGIMQFIERETNGRVLLGAGTLYGAINTLLGKKWIEQTGDVFDRNKKEYIITNLGRQYAEKELKRISEIYNLASGIIGGNLL